jgi:hypothetical protein
MQLFEKPSEGPGTMSRRPAPFTERGLRRAISAARKEGLFVNEIRPDGTLITSTVDNALAGVAHQNDNPLDQWMAKHAG